MLKEETIHFTLSIFAGLISWSIFDNLWAILIALFFGFFIDLDHLIDYFLFKKKLKFNPDEFFGGKFFDIAKKVFLFFHGFEYALIMGIVAIWVVDMRWALTAAALSLVFHLIYDTLTNRPIWPTYFILFRIAVNFNHAKFKFNPKHLEK